LYNNYRYFSCIRILLQQANKELTGDSTHTRSELIELENTVKKFRGRGAWPEGEDLSSSHTVVHAAAAYRKFITDCNLVDSWAVWEAFGKILSSEGRNEGDAVEKASFQLLIVKRLEAEECEMASTLGTVSAQRLEIVDGTSRKEQSSTVD
jgi:hypothetical protein